MFYFRRQLTAANKLMENETAQAKRCEQMLNDTTKHFEEEKGLAILVVSTYARKSNCVLCSGIGVVF